MISTLTFLRRGIAAENPTVYKMTDEEYAKLREMAGEQVDLAREELEAAQAAAAANDEVDGMDEDGAESDSADSDEDPDIAKAKAAAARHGKDGSDDALAEYDLDNYDESAEIPDPTSRLFSNVSSLAVPAEEDPYLTLGGDEDEEDKDDIRVLPTDNLIVSARTEDDVSQVEVYIYERSEGNLYVRNDWLVPGMPLCMEWLDFGLGGEKGTFPRQFYTVAPFSDESSFVFHRLVYCDRIV